MSPIKELRAIEEILKKHGIPLHASFTGDSTADRVDLVLRRLKACEKAYKQLKEEQQTPRGFVQ